MERLREEAFGRYLIARWEEAVEELDLRAEIPPQLSNTDGDPLLITVDHFALEAGACAEVKARLAGMDDVEIDDDEPGGDSVYVFLAAGNRMHASWENTVIGQAYVEREALRLETNSRERANALRARVEAACGGLLRHRVREHSDPLSRPVQAAADSAPPEPPPPEAEQLLLDFKQRHYTVWIDEALPALGGLTPREAVRTARGRDAVDVLIKEMEHREQGEGPVVFDFRNLRQELGLPE